MYSAPITRRLRERLGEKFVPELNHGPLHGGNLSRDERERERRRKMALFDLTGDRRLIKAADQKLDNFSSQVEANRTQMASVSSDKNNSMI